MDKFIIKEKINKFTIKQVGSPGPKGDDGASSTLQNVGDGAGIWKETVDSVASLKSIISDSPILMVSDTEDTVNLNIDQRQLNNLIQNSLTGINEQLEIIDQSLENLNSEVVNMDNTINSILNSITTINGEVENINNTLSTQHDDIYNLQSDINAFNIKFDDINTKITELNTKNLPVGGTAGQVLAKKSSTNYDTEWVNQSGGGNLDPFSNYTRRRYIYSIGNFQNSQIRMVTQGYGNSSTNYQFNSGIPVSFVDGKGDFYQYSKFTYKDPTATGTATTGYICGSVYADTYNFLDYGDVWLKFGLTTVNDPLGAMFVGLSSGNISTPITANDIFNNSFGNGAWAVGFGFEPTDTNLQFFFIRSGSYKFKINFNQFTGNFIASDILAKQAEKAISYRLVNRTDLTGLDLYFYNHNTKRGGKYVFNWSQLNQTHMFNKEQVSFSTLYGYWHNPGFTGVKDIFNLFAIDITN